MAPNSYARDDYNALGDDEFRILVRRFLSENHPPELRSPPKRLHRHEAHPWYMAMSAAGWLAPAWPRQYGGMGLDPSKQLIYVEEFENFGAARVPDHGFMLLGPLLINYGSEEQKNLFLPKIISGEHIWCQGYSEPNAGSDLASLRTEAVLDGDEWVVNGQKTWTTLAGDADWIFCLVRTDKAAKKQEGISFLLIPMNSPGVTVKPIVNLNLEDEFSEVFFDNVRVPKDNIVGLINQGWTMAKRLLGFERIFLGSPRQAANALSKLYGLAVHYGVEKQETFLDRYTGFRLELEDHQCLFSRIADTLRQGRPLGPEVSFLKLHQTGLFQRISEYAVELAGQDAGYLDPIDSNRNLNVAGGFMNSRAATIYGGTTQVQKNILAQSLMGLPAK
ncbi:acyl-CoA dehydrogenase family protein [Sinorhizobium medicae]|uniref:acyl-CoA dehydrogenase family protein n=1 Tax=Sinorhizobium medicae TaxID=110321 RepID=UPI000FDB6FBE|nr:acyl-CoA dehydrogenase family protein [Sinorhizobium medicae]RVO73513.1 acyl-CoA dehydrogenase [Sinorhizobium medicae]